MGFAENLKEIRNKRNITQEQLAEILSVSRQTILMITLFMKQSRVRYVQGQLYRREYAMYICE